MKTKKYFSILILLVLTVSVLVSFQNCGGIKLEPALTQTAQSASTFSGQFCSEPVGLIQSQQKLLFVIDMSSSNLGNSDYTNCSGFDHLCSWFFGLGVDPSVSGIANQTFVTDGTGLRFQAVENFISSDPTNPNYCPYAQNASYFMMGFSENPMFGNSSSSCYSPYVTTTASAQDQLNNLINEQNNQIYLGQYPLGRARSGPSQNPFLMTTTSYYSALSCASNQILTDMASSQPSVSNYKMFFLTDGKPLESDVQRNDNLFPSVGNCESIPSMAGACMIVKVCGCSVTNGSSCSCVSSFNSCHVPGGQYYEYDVSCVQAQIAQNIYPNQIQSLYNYVQRDGSSLEMIPVYYGHDAEYAAAQAVLDPLAQITNPQAHTLRTTDLTNLSHQLCEQLSSSIDVPSSVSQFMVINLTAIMKHNTLLPDADMDGVDDATEDATSGFNKLNPRSSGVLDRLGYDYYNNHNHTLFSPPANCASTNLGWEINACDKAILAAPTLNGFDSDGDGIPDYIEAIRGLSPFHANTSSDDFDGDGFSDIQEVAHGTDPQADNAHTYPVDPQFETQVNLRAANSSAGCSSTSEAYSFDLQNIPLVHVSAYTEAAHHVFDLSHQTDENVILIYYETTPLASGFHKRLYAAVVKVKYNQMENISVPQNSFVFLGEF
jgi:hypothetical protein